MAAKKIIVHPLTAGIRYALYGNAHGSHMSPRRYGAV